MNWKTAGTNRAMDEPPRRTPETIELAQAAQEDQLENMGGGRRPRPGTSRKCSQVGEDLNIAAGWK